MGEKADDTKNADAGDKKSSDSGANVTVVLKMDMHCEGCAKKVKRAVKNFDGVEEVQADSASGRLTVVGKVDPEKIKQRLQEKTNKKVDLISPQPAKKDDGGNDKKSEVKAEKKAEEKKPEEKKPEEKMVVLKVRLHCDGCIQKIKKIILKFKGVNAVSVDAAKDQVAVTGTMEVGELVLYLKEKLKRNVEVIPSKKEEGGGEKGKKEGGGEKKEKEADKKEKEADKKEKEKEKESGGNGAKEEKKPAAPSEAGEGVGEPKVEVSKMEYHGYGNQLHQPMYWNDGQVYSQQYAYAANTPQMYSQQYAYAANTPQMYSHSYAVEPHPYHSQGYAYHDRGHEAAHYVSEGYVMDPRLQAPQIFSDENPNACSVM